MIFSIVINQYIHLNILPIKRNKFTIDLKLKLSYSMSDKEKQHQIDEAEDKRYFFDGFFLGATVVGLILATIIALSIYSDAPGAGEGGLYSPRELAIMQREVAPENVAELSTITEKGQKTTVDGKPHYILQSQQNPINMNFFRLLIPAEELSDQDIMRLNDISDNPCIIGTKRFIEQDQYFLTSWDKEGQRLIEYIDFAPILTTQFSDRIDQISCISINDWQSTMNLVIQVDKIIEGNASQELWLFSLKDQSFRMITF